MGFTASKSFRNGCEKPAVDMEIDIANGSFTLWIRRRAHQRACFEVPFLDVTVVSSAHHAP